MDRLLLFIACVTPILAVKNVLFFASDDMRPEIGVYHPSHPVHTPNLDKLASQSLLLKKAYVQQAVCSPSRTSLLTGIKYIFLLNTRLFI
jgi:iduronate 2-sulfatase